MDSICRPNLLNGFKVLKLKFSANSTSSHEIFIKEHAVRKHDDEIPPGRSLYVLNIPPFATLKSLKRVFSEAGKVQSVIYQKNAGSEPQRGFKAAYIVFSKRDSMLACLKFDSLTPLSTEKEPVLTGLKKYAHEYNSSLLDHDVLQQRVKEFMEHYSKTKEKSLQEKEKVDDEGWQVVTKKGRKPGLSRKQSLQNRVSMKSQIKSKKKELKNFYPFQIRESKMKAVAELKKKYEEEKKKVELLKSQRKFKPY